VEPSNTFDVELGPALQLAPGADTERLPITGGFSVRARYGSTLSATVGVVALLPTTLRYASADAHALWLPLDLSIRLTSRMDELAAGVELGPTLTLLRATGERVENAQTQTRFEAGARLAVLARLTMSEDISTYASVYGLLFPRPFTLEVRPDERVGETPTWWLGASLGLVLGTSGPTR
jgi:hypothetical protein